MVLDIGSIQTQAKSLLNPKMAYNDVLEALIKTNYYYNDELQIPTINQLSEATSLSSAKVRKHIRAIYEDILKASTNSNHHAFTFEEISVFFVLTNRANDKHLTFETTALPVIPRVGEDIQIPYFSAYLDTTSFYVDSVIHDLEDNKQVIYIHLEPGHFSPYWHFRKDQAYQEGDISIKDLMDCSEYELKKKLLKKI